MKNFMTKITSRKFLSAVTIIVVGIIAMFTDVPVEQVEQAADGVSEISPYAQYVPKAIGALMAIVGFLGYAKAEAEVDAARAGKAHDAVAPHEGARL